MFVQIAPYNYLSRPWFKGTDISLGCLVEQQASVLSLRNTAMARTGDLGDTANIHPSKKQEVGRRLSLLALGNYYEKPDNSYTYPSFASFVIKDRNITVKFKNAEKGLIQREKVLNGFEIAGSNKIFYPAIATIDQQTVNLSSVWVEKPVAIRYCFKNSAVVDLFNENNLPVFPFRTDNWEIK